LIAILNDDGIGSLSHHSREALSSSSDSRTITTGCISMPVGPPDGRQKKRRHPDLNDFR
jgi:hypothetical protein